jgi:hypothetical protein
MKRSAATPIAPVQPWQAADFAALLVSIPWVVRSIPAGAAMPLAPLPRLLKRLPIIEFVLEPQCELNFP